MASAVILLSGGIDSATTLYLAKKSGLRPECLVFDYGQRHEREILSARKIAKAARAACRVVSLRLPHKKSALLDKKSPLPAGRSAGEIKKKIPATYVPARNLIFLSIAASYAESVKAGAIFIGAHTDDYSGYPDCRKIFFEAFRKAVAAGTKAGSRIKICAPLLDKKKCQIIEIAVRLGVPLEKTWSCYAGGAEPCGVCDSCFFRARAFNELGIVDPALGAVRKKGKLS